MAMNPSLESARNAPWQERLGRGDTASNDYGKSNGFEDCWRDPTDTYDIPVTQVDSAGNILLGRAEFNPVRQPIPMYVAVNGQLANNQAQTIFIAPANMDLTDVLEIHATAGSDGGAVTITLTRETDGMAPGTGTPMLSASINLKATNETFQAATLAGNYIRRPGGVRGGQISLKAGDHLSIAITGTVTSLAGLCLTAYAMPGYKYPFASFTALAATGVISTPFFIANAPRSIASVWAVWSAPASGAGTITVDITKDSNTNAPGAGVSILNAAINVNNTAGANAVVSPALTATASRLSLDPSTNDRLSIKATGTMTGITGLCIVVFFNPTFTTDFDVSLVLPLNAAFTSQQFLIASRPMEVVDAQCIFGTAAGAAANLLLERLTGTTAPGSGVGMQSDNANAGFNLNATANTMQEATLLGRKARVLARGDRLSAKVSGTVTSSALGCVTVTFAPR